MGRGRDMKGKGHSCRAEGHSAPFPAALVYALVLCSSTRAIAARARAAIEHGGDLALLSLGAISDTQPQPQLGPSFFNPASALFKHTKPPSSIVYYGARGSITLERLTALATIHVPPAGPHSSRQKRLWRPARGAPRHRDTCCDKFYGFLRLGSRSGRPQAPLWSLLSVEALRSHRQVPREDPSLPVLVLGADNLINT